LNLTHLSIECPKKNNQTDDSGVSEKVKTYHGNLTISFLRFYCRHTPVLSHRVVIISTDIIQKETELKRFDKNNAIESMYVTTSKNKMFFIAISDVLIFFFR
jgi:hypothetical protein